MKKNKLYGVGALALAITISGGGMLIGQAAAADTSTATNSVVNQTDIQSGNNGNGMTDDIRGQGGFARHGGFGGQGPLGGPGGRGGHPMLDDAALATALGMTEADFETAEHSGKSIAAMAEEKGVAVQTVTDLVVTQMTVGLDQQLADSKITQAQYDTQKANIATRADEIVNRSFDASGASGGAGFGRHGGIGGQGPLGGPGGRGGHPMLDDAALATALGMTEADFETAEHSGKSIAAMAEEKGVAVQTVTDLVTKQLTTKLDQLLADGKITQTQYDTQKANIATATAGIVNHTFTDKGHKVAPDTIQS